ncbi:hyaluronate lyase [Photobacterium damselae subsp. damselae]|uniref:polysaccharide lyase 8 family protein n=1 Tax=Photobacterium damselae TaxID=38293 RepID=UPI000D0489B9|nr:polysaccharide lyase 8 family protein [Photobacterium damselae]AWK84203.1 hyaluronate lyase [Photobacterium damselae]MCG3815909.1 polysaccharide lyase 8 family protein [Photobacterium damselae]PSB83810.1 hyaluronate lyase [Photobacterium damselae subsp. damselae]UKA04098.1 polysaccharide lyase 8 family protein [Photobacterium damselae subsp. damselae]
MKQLSLLTLSIICAFSSLPVQANNNESENIASTSQLEVNEQAFSQLRQKWAEGFLGASDIAFDQKLKQMVITANNGAQKHWSSMNTASTRLSLWNDLVLDDQSEAGKKVLGAKLRSSYQRLFIMAKAYQLRGGVLQHNPQLLAAIIDGLQFLNQHYYKVGAKEWGNWWHWELGTPKDIHNILVVLYDQLPAQLITNYLDATRYFTPLPTHLGAGPGADVSSNPHYRESTGGNRTDNTQVVLLRGILANDSAEIFSAIQALSPVVDYVQASDGFYQDGSFLQHYDIAYNGTYGNVLLGGLGAQMSLVANSPWQVTDPKLQEIYPLIFKSYAPLLYRGTMMEFVNGRAISRPQEQGHHVGHNVIASLIHYLDGASAQYLYPLQQLIKTQISQDTYLDFFDSINHIGNYQKAQQLLQNQQVDVKDNVQGVFTFPAMDRVVYRTNDWAFSLAMHSSRLGNFECMNNENRKGWFTGDGMSYFYTNQLDHFHDYWPVVDSYRLPGTTVDDQLMLECQGQRNQIKGGRKLQMDWVGSAKLDDIAVAGMDFINWNETLTAKKSWFMFEDEVVMLGSNISSQIDANITTTVANRKQLDNGNINVFINEYPWAGQYPNKIKSLFISNDQMDESGMGYVFLSPPELSVKQDTRIGNWNEIGTKSGEVSAEFITATIRHSVDHDSYAYVVLPASDLDDISEYRDEKPIKIIRQDDIAHIIRYKDDNVIAANIWQQQKVELTRHISAIGKMAILVQKEEGTKRISVSDPLQNQTTVELEFKKPIKIMSDPDQRLQISGQKILTIDVTNLKGNSYQFIVK